MIETPIKKLSFLNEPDDALKAYFEIGFHIEENLLNPDECDALIKASSTLENAVNGTYRPQMMPHRYDDIYLATMRKPTLVNIMNRLVGGKAMGLQSELFYCKPGTRGFSLHQDNFFVQAPLNVFASAWIALTDTYLEKGGLIVYPGSHKAGLLPVRKLDLAKDSSQDPNANNEETIVPPCYSLLNATVPKGAALFIHGHVVHGSNPNQTQEWRYVLLNTYIREGEPFRVGNYAQREMITL